MSPDKRSRRELPPGARLIGWLTLLLLIELCIALAGVLMFVGV
jgi:hypothetical protein